MLDFSWPPKRNSWFDEEFRQAHATKQEAYIDEPELLTSFVKAKEKALTFQKENEAAQKAQGEEIEDMQAYQSPKHRV